MNNEDEFFFNSDSDSGAELVEQKSLKKKAKKNKPIEQSSKVAVSRLRNVAPVKKKLIRDPRFSSGASGNFNADLYAKSYSFINDIKTRERTELEQELKRTNREMKKLEKAKKADAIEEHREQASHIKRVLNVINSQEHAERQKKDTSAIKKLWKKTESSAVQAGIKKRQYHLKDSDLKKLVLLSKIENMKDSQIEKIMEKKRMKNASKEKKYLPLKR